MSSAAEPPVTALPHDIRPPEDVLDIIRVLQGAGFSTWCVGGAVRDALLGSAHLDWDLATAASTSQVRRLFARTVPVGIEFGTVGVLDKRGRMHEVTTFRRDVTHDGRHATVEFGASLDEDLARRDLTINAIAFDPISGRLHDPFGGQRDLASRVIRAVGDPRARMVEDRLRALRAIRLASRFEFSIDAATWQAIVDSGPYLARLSPERVKQEVEKTMDQATRPSLAFRRWRDAGAFASLAPLLSEVDDAVLDAIDCLPRPGLAGRAQRRSVRIAALLSDLSREQAVDLLRSLRFSNHDMAFIGALVGQWAAQHMPLSRALVSTTGLDDRAVRRLASFLGRLRTSAFARLAAARWSVARSRGDGADTPSAARVRDLHRRLLYSAFRDPLALADLAVDGDDLRSLGIVSGPQIGRTLARLLELVLDDPALNTRATLLARASTADRSVDGRRDA